MARRACLGAPWRLLAAAALLLIAAQAPRATVAKIHHSVVDVDDRKLIPLAPAMGFSAGGKIVISISDINIYLKHGEDKNVDLDNFGFFLSSVEADATLEADLANPDKCVLTQDSLFTFKDSGVKQVIEETVPSFTFQFKVENSGLYYLYFANCEPNMPVSFDSKIELYNVNKWGGKDYLSVGEQPLETVFWVMFSLFTVLCGIWAWYCWQNRASAHRIHLLMGLLCAFKALTTMSQAGMYHFIERTGHADGWNIAYYIFTFFRGILFFTVVVLIGTGWSYMKPFLGDKERRILLVVVPLQVFANIAIIITDEESPSIKDWFTWRDMFHLVDIICCCAILFPIVWSIKHLREASHTDGKAARNLEKLTLFRQFYVVVVVYIYFTRIVVYLLESTMPYEYAWLADAADQFATLAFYVWVAIKFSPTDTNPYLKLEQSEIEL